MLPMRPASRQRTRRRCAAVIGTSMKSSWSLPIAESPFASKTPMTVNGILLTRMDFPSALVSGKSFSSTVLPITMTFAPWRTSLWFMSRP